MAARTSIRCTRDAVDYEAIACAFDLLRFDGEDLRRKPLGERKAALLKLIGRKRDGIRYVARACRDACR
jgi:ATP-dependent DNA ligase